MASSGGRTNRARCGVDELDQILPRRTFWWSPCPHRKTDNMFDAAMLAKLPDDALVVNVGRSSLVNTDADRGSGCRPTPVCLGR